MAYIIFLVLEGKQKRSWEVSCVWSDAPVQAGTVRPSLLFKAIGKLHFPINWFNLAKVEQDNSHDVNRHSCFVSGRVVFFFPNWFLWTTQKRKKKKSFSCNSSYPHKLLHCVLRMFTSVHNNFPISALPFYFTQLVLPWALSRDRRGVLCLLMSAILLRDTLL